METNKMSLSDVASILKSENRDDLAEIIVSELETIFIKSQAGLCQFSHEGTREFLKDIMKMTANFEPFKNLKKG